MGRLSILYATLTTSLFERFESLRAVALETMPRRPAQPVKADQLIAGNSRNGFPNLTTRLR